MSISLWIECQESLLSYSRQPKNINEKADRRALTYKLEIVSMAKDKTKQNTKSKFER